MRALITGATGCVGANIAEALLASGYDVRALRRPSSQPAALEGLDVEFATGDVLDPASLTAATRDCALVFHTAAVSRYWRSDRESLYRVNVEGTRNLLAAAMAAGVQRVVCTSSIAALGVPRSAGALLDETCTFNVSPHRFPYGHSKYLADREVDAAVQRGLDAVIVNPTSVIGQRDVNFVGGELLRMTVQAWFVLTPCGGMGVIGAKEAGVGHVLAAERGSRGERYILSGQNIRHLDLIRLVAEVTGGKRPLGVVPKPLALSFAVLLRGLDRVRLNPFPLDPSQLDVGSSEIFADTTKARAALGFVGSPARVAVEEAWQWYRSHNLL